MVLDVIKPNLSILFCGINPGVMTGKTGYHFAHPSNRFWKVIYRSGLIPIPLKPSEQRKLLGYGIGITNIVSRATPRASQVAKSEFEKGWMIFIDKVKKYKPQRIVVLGVGAYTQATGIRNVTIGRQEATVHNAKLWVLPSPSGLNANHSEKDLVAYLTNLKKEVEQG